MCPHYAALDYIVTIKKKVQFNINKRDIYKNSLYIFEKYEETLISS